MSRRESPVLVSPAPPTVLGFRRFLIRSFTSEQAHAAWARARAGILAPSMRDRERR